MTLALARPSPVGTMMTDVLLLGRHCHCHWELSPGTVPHWHRIDLQMIAAGSALPPHHDCDHDRLSVCLWDGSFDFVDEVRWMGWVATVLNSGRVLLYR